MNNPFLGTGIAIVTPYNQDGSVDHEALKKIVNFNVENGTNYIVISGTTGESVTITKQEKKEIIKTVKEANANRLPLVLGIGGNNTANITGLGFINSNAPEAWMYDWWGENAWGAGGYYGQRYGGDPVNMQMNGWFNIDEARGTFNFSSVNFEVCTSLWSTTHRLLSNFTLGTNMKCLLSLV